MKAKLNYFFIALAFLAIGSVAQAATITWIATNGGDWNTATNWSPNQVPESGDDVIITNSGSYAVTNGPSVTLDNLILGGTNGTQTLTISSLTLTNTGLVNSNGVLNWGGGDLTGSLTVLQGGTMSISNSVYFDEASPYTNNAALTNYGTVVWAGNIASYANEGSLGGSATIDNAGLWEAVANNTIQYETASSNLFINTGTLEKIGGTGASTINWSFDNEGGTVNTPTGSFSMGNWIGIGLVLGNAMLSSGSIAGTLEPGTVMNFSGNVNGSLTVSSNAIANWYGGDLTGSITVLQGGTLSISNTVYFDEASPYNSNAGLTNYGTVVWAGNITSYANEGSLGGSATIDNAGLWESVADNMIQYETASTNLFINTGTLEKIGGTGTSTINWKFASLGTINTSSGTFTLNWGGPSTVNGNLTLSGSSIAFPLTVASNAVLNLSGNDLESSLTVLQGGTLSITNTVYFDETSPYSNNAALTNYGTVVWAGNIASYANEGSLGGSATIDNAGLWEAVANNTIQYETTSTNLFINTGTLEKIGGTGTSTINWSFDNEGGTVNTPTGSFSMGNWIGSGLVLGNATLSSGSTIGGAIASNAVINWSGGDLEGALTILQGGTLSISNTVYFDEASPYNNNAALTNYGTVIWACNIASYANEGSQGGSATIDNAGLWEAVANNTIQFETTSSNLFINTGTLEKIGGTGTSAIYWNLLNNGGILDSQTNTLSLAGSYNLTGGTLNFGISSLTGYGIIDLSGSPATLTGTLSGIFNAGFLPAVNNSWQIINYTSLSGVFTQTNLPPTAVWQVTPNPNSLTIKVLKLVPQITWPTPTSIVYGTALSGTQLDATANWNGSAVTGSFIYSPPLGTVFQSGSNQTLSVTFMPADTSTYTNVTTNVMINVQKAPLTVTANSSAKTYGQTVTFAGTEFGPMGLVNGDMTTSATLASAGAPPTAPVSGSPFPITITNAVGDPGLTNYNITYVNGALTVNTAPLGITANSRGKTYGQTVTFTGTEFTWNGLQNSETIGTVMLTSAGAISNAPVSGSPYNILPSAATGGNFTAGNYTIGYTNGALTVGTAPLGITATNIMKTYGQTVTFAGTEFTSSGLQNSETIGTVTLTSAGAISNAPVSGSPYNILPSAATGGTFSAGNYTIGYTNGGLTVNKAMLTITANSTNKIVGETLTFAGTEFTASGLQNSDTIDTVTLTSAGALPSAAAGPYNIDPSAPIDGTFSQGNYSDVFVPGTLTVLGTPVLALTLLGDQYVLTFQSVSGQAYQLESSTNLASGSWLSLGGSINGTGGTVNVTNTVAFPQSFFQLQIAPQ